MERERDLLAGPKPASTCIRSESVGLLGADGESVVMGGRVIALLPAEGLLQSREDRPLFVLYKVGRPTMGG